MKTISWGIIGCGDVTEIKSGPAFNKVENSNLIAVMRRNGEKAKDYAKRHNVAKWYDDASALINDHDVNAIYIATPPAYHELYALMAIAKAKPVYIEKPMTTNAVSAKRIADEANRSKVKVSIAHYRRMQPLFLKIKSLLKEAAIGKVQFVDLQLFLPHQTSLIAKTETLWRLDPAVSGGGLFHDLAPHQLDLMYYFFGEPIKTIGLSANVGKHYAADDSVGGQILFDQDIFFNGSWNFTGPSFFKKDNCMILGSNGVLQFSIFESAPLVLTNGDGEKIFQFDSLQHVQQPMIEEVVRYFLGERNNPSSPEEGVEVMKMIDAFTSASPA